MPYRATLLLTSGDRSALDRTVDRLRRVADRKGANVSGPHTRPTRELDIPLYKSPRGDETFDTWRYTVYTRKLEVVGHESVTRAIAAETAHAVVDITLTVTSAEPAESSR